MKQIIEFTIALLGFGLVSIAVLAISYIGGIVMVIADFVSKRLFNKTLL